MGFALATIGLSLFCVAAIVMLVARKKLAKTRYGEAVVGFGIVLGMFILTCSWLPAIEGTVHGRRSTKGGFEVIVVNASGEHNIIGDIDARCPDGSHVVKPAWTQHYECAGMHGTPSDVFIYVVALLELAGAVAILVRGIRTARLAESR